MEQLEEFESVLREYDQEFKRYTSLFPLYFLDLIELTPFFQNPLTCLLLHMTNSKSLPYEPVIHVCISKGLPSIGMFLILVLFLQKRRGAAAWI